jgi:hypothetical protein
MKNDQAVVLLDSDSHSLDFSLMLRVSDLCIEKERSYLIIVELCVFMVIFGPTQSLIELKVAQFVSMGDWKFPIEASAILRGLSIGRNPRSPLLKHRGCGLIQDFQYTIHHPTTDCQLLKVFTRYF